MQTSMPPKSIPRHTVFCLGKGNYKEFCGRHVAWEQLYMLLFPTVGYENYQVWQEKKLRLELFPILCSFLAVRTRRSESFLCDREGMEVMKQKKAGVQNPLLPSDKGNLHSSCPGKISSMSKKWLINAMAIWTAITLCFLILPVRCWVPFFLLQKRARKMLFFLLLLPQLLICSPRIACR